MAGKAEPKDQKRLQSEVSLDYWRTPQGITQKMPARIYQTPKSAMQSGKAKTDTWVLEFEQSEARKADPLMGWTGSGDTQSQVKLNFPTKEAAKAYAEKYGIPARVHATPTKALKLQAYADNFR